MGAFVVYFLKKRMKQLSKPALYCQMTPELEPEPEPVI